MAEYKLVTESYNRDMISDPSSEFSALINKEIRLGWELQGGVSYCNDLKYQFESFSQAMVKEDA